MRRWPTAQWLADIGISKDQVAKTMARQPQLLAHYGIDQKMTPTVQ